MTLPDPLEPRVLVGDIVLAYLAGVIDSDGSISVTPRSAEISAAMEECYLRSRQLNKVGR